MPMKMIFGQLSSGTMIENLLNQHASFGSRQQIVKVLTSLQDGGSVSVSGLRKVSVPGSAVHLLRYLGIVTQEDDKIALTNSIATEDIPLAIFQSLFLKLKAEKLLHHFLNEHSVYYDRTELHIFVKNNGIPLKFSPIRNLLLDFELFVRDSLILSQFYINPNLQNWFQENVVPAIEESRRGDNPFSKLVELRARQAAAGQRAEMFVLDYERVQRKNHKNGANIKIVSDIDTNAGYDIESYESDDSILLDKFIEVKSYIGTPSFYWSSNEMEIAKAKGDLYHLYLVDGAAIKNTGYRPIQIKNPHKNLLLDDDWISRDDGRFYEKKTV